MTVCLLALLSISLSMCRLNYSKRYEKILMQFCGEVKHRSKRNWSNLGGLVDCGPIRK